MGKLVRHCDGGTSFKHLRVRRFLLLTAWQRKILSRQQRTERCLEPSWPCLHRCVACIEPAPRLTNFQLLDTEAGEATTSLSTLLQLPTHVLDLIFDELEVLDRCVFALTCRKLLALAQNSEHLDYIINSPPNEHRLQHFFEIQLGYGWIPEGLSYCPDCGRFVSTDQTHWRYVSEKLTREHSGSIARVWRQRREDGWLR